MTSKSKALPLYPKGKENPSSKCRAHGELKTDSPRERASTPDRAAVRKGALGAPSVCGPVVPEKGLWGKAFP